MPPETLDLTATESGELLEASRQWLADEPVRLDALNPMLWQLTELEPARTRFAQMRGASSQRASGRNIDNWLPRGPAARSWRRLANELQMLWHTHPVNQARAERGLPVANGLWFEGCARALTKRPFGTVISQDPVLHGLAHASGAEIIDECEPDRIAEALRDGTTARERCLVDVSHWRSAAMPGVGVPGTDWADGWTRFAGWLAALDDALAFGRGRALCWVLTGEARALTLDLSARGRLRFWQRSTPQDWFEHERPR